MSSSYVLAEVTPKSQSRRKYLIAACENMKSSGDRARVMLDGNVEELIGWAMSLLEKCEQLEDENLLLHGKVEELSKTDSSTPRPPAAR